jgi:preprotein translocase subunit SecF
MAFGIFVATFSSIYVASPLLLWIEHRWPRTATDKGANKAAVQASRTEIPAAQRATRDRQPERAASR